MSLYEEGKIRAVGISNFYVDRMVEFCEFNDVKPMVNQMERHPLNQNTELQEWEAKYGVQPEAWAPFGEGRGGLFTNPVLAGIGQAHGKSAAQVMLRWNLQRGVVVIPKSVHKERMEQNLDVFDFELTADEMAQIAALDTKTSSFFSHADPKMVSGLPTSSRSARPTTTAPRTRRTGRKRTRYTRELCGIWCMRGL